MLQATTDQKLRVLLLIHAALIMGVVMFAIIVLVINKPAATAPPLGLMEMRIACVALLAASVILATALRGAAINRMATRALRAGEDELITAFSTLSIVRAAIAEGAPLLAIVVFMLSADMTDLALAGAGVLVLAAMIPLPGKWRSFVEAVESRRGRERA